MDYKDYKEEFAQKLRDQIHREVGERMDPKIRRPQVMLAGEPHWGFAWGLIIVLIGISWLLYNSGIIEFNPVARYWPALIIVFGIMNLMSQSGRFFGFLLILVGGFLFLNKLGYTHLTFGDIWPVVIIALGLLLMWGSLETRGFIRAKGRILDQLREHVNPSNLPPGALNAIAVFGGCERRVTGKNFQGGKATAVFGGIELDFRDADMEEEAVLEINCVFGGVEVRVPETWNVHSRNIPVFGGYEDTTRQPTVAPDAKPKTLTITGMVIFSGVEIKN